ncbi:hypothetical protein Verru16b_01856 [Lacunisphaera limnophila]|uniref:mannan endo-1,4-beta-mannosidase n=1 Tax=Lacunisphaera limnophila TaxID=1838286 RepID=A0A1D8AV61_9BACT|nr:hypothetical protein [Lacunisphaera limnophila]AOS44787.1 hypothetical protein Verru16b_01856 [Lacunisphaera limnophila]
MSPPTTTSRLVLLALTLCLTALTAAPALPPPEPLDHFITRKGDRLYDGDREYRFVSVNMPDVLQIITNYRFDGETPELRLRVPDEFEQRDAIRTVRQMGGRTLRTFMITARQGPHPAVMFDVAQNPVVANESALLALDRLLQISREEGVRLLIPLIAYRSALRGDPDTYGPDFWVTGSEANLKFKNMIAQVLGRTNPLTGIPYRDDPTIFGWQTGNELVIGTDPVRRRWLHDIAAYIKKLAPNHLHIDGRNKPNDVYDLYDEFADSPHIDAVSYHTYVNLPQADSPAGTLRLIRNQLRGRMPVIVTEVAMYTPPKALRELLEEIIAGGTVGVQWWGIRFHNRDGGFYKHSDRGSKYEDLNWPGFAEPPGGLPEVSRERELLGILRDYAARITGTTAPAPAAPEAPVLLPASDPGHLSWQGSAGASAYEIQRAPAVGGPWTSLTRDFGDHLAPYTPLFCDTTAAPGGTYYYRVLARNNGGVSAPSNLIGPLQPDRHWLVDDLFDETAWDASSTNLQITKAYAHDAYLEDIAIIHRRDPAQSGRLVYRLPGPVRSFTLTAFDSETPPRFFLTDPQGARTEVTPQVTAYQQGKRARYSTDLPANHAALLEIELPAGAAPMLALGRVELSWIPTP